jgi:transcriptional regulator GlxA family with amidase domain
MDRSDAGLPTYTFTVCAVRPGLVPTTSGYRIHVDHGLDCLAEADLIAVPGWTTEHIEPPPQLITALREAFARGARVLSVCSGAFLLAAAGLLDGRRVTTHWRDAPILAARYPHIRVDPDVLYIDDGPVVTSAGTAAAIDACLHLVRHEHGTTVANAVARLMVVSPHRSGGQAQFAQPPVPPVKDQFIADLMQWIQSHLDQPVTVQNLAARAIMSPRTLARRFKAATGTTPHRWLLDQRLRLAETLLENTDLAIDHIAQQSGLGSPDTLRHHFAGRRRTRPAAYRRTFRSPTA